MLEINENSEENRFLTLGFDLAKGKGKGKSDDDDKSDDDEEEEEEEEEEGEEGGENLDDDFDDY